MVNGALYLVTGKEEFLKDEFVRDLRSTLFPNDPDPGLNIQEFSADRAPLSEVLDFVRTAPFLGARRLAILRRVEELDEEEKKALLASLSSLPASAALVLVAGDASPKKDAFLRALSEKTSHKPCYPPFEDQWSSWVQQRARKAGLEATAEAADVIVERVGQDASGVVSAIESLRLYIDPRKRIEAADVSALLGRSLQQDAYDLVDAIFERNGKRSVEIASRLLREGSRGYELIAVLAGQVERLRRGAGLLSSGRSLKEVGQELSINAYFLEKFGRQAQKVQPARAGVWLKKLLECDEAVKSGKLADSIALEKLVLELCA